MAGEGDSLTETGDAGQDRLSRLGPNLRLRVQLVDAKVVTDGGLEFASASVDAAADLLLSQFGEERASSARDLISMAHTGEARSSLVSKRGIPARTERAK